MKNTPFTIAGCQKRLDEIETIRQDVIAGRRTIRVTEMISLLDEMESLDRQIDFITDNPEHYL